MIKNILLFLISVLIGLIIVITGYAFYYHPDISPSNPLIPATQFSLRNPPVQSLTGEIASYSGNVAWQSRTANFAVLINSKIKLHQGEALVTQGNGQATVVFPNTAAISLSNNSQVNIIQTLPADLVIEQTQGSVEYEKSGNDTPLSIRILDLLLNVANGQTTVILNKDTQEINISVNSGNITAAYTDTQNNTNTVDFKQGQDIVFNNNTKNYSILNP